MNMHTPITEACDGNMTSKGQVLIPKALRDRVGLLPGGEVTIGLNEQGDVVVRARSPMETREERITRIRAAIDRIAGTRPTGFATTDEYMDFIRPWRNDL